MKSIVEHKHQKAAYCGITWFDSDAYPEEYRGVLYMGNIHGGCINADIAERAGSTYKARPHPGFPAKPGAFDDPENTIAKIGEGSDAKLADFLTANDAWFMPVVQKTGPDGCLYILDWYDRYHCYQDANADPEGIERAKGRLYRVRYKDTPHSKPFDLAKASDDELIERLADPNVYYRETAQRLLSERDTPAIYEILLLQLKSGLGPKRDPYRGMFTLCSLSLPAAPNENGWVEILHEHADPLVRAWFLRVIGDYPSKDDAIAQNMMTLACVHWAEDPSPAVQLQAVIAASKFAAIDPLKLQVYMGVLKNAGDDPLIPHIVWQNLYPLLEDHSDEFLAIVKEYDLKKHPNLAKIMPRVTEVILDQNDSK